MDAPFFVYHDHQNSVHMFTRSLKPVPSIRILWKVQGFTNIVYNHWHFKTLAKDFVSEFHVSKVCLATQTSLQAPMTGLVGVSTSMIWSVLRFCVPFVWLLWRCEQHQTDTKKIFSNYLHQQVKSCKVWDKFTRICIQSSVFWYTCQEFCGKRLSDVALMAHTCLPCSYGLELVFNAVPLSNIIIGDFIIMMLWIVPNA